MPKNRASHKLSYAGPLPRGGAKPSPFTQRWAALAAFLVIVLIFLLYYGGQAWLLLITDLVLEGAFAAYWLSCATLAGWFLLDLACLTRRDPRPATTLLLPTAAALGFGIIGLLTLALGHAGLLNHWTASGLLLTLALPQSLRLVMRPPSLQIGQWLRERTTAGFLWLPVAPFLAISLAGAMLPPGLLWKNADDPHPYDVLEYHLQVPREWYEAGRIIPLHHNAFSFFPMGAEMHDLLAMHLRGGPWDGMYLAQLMSVTFMALTLLAIYGVCRTILKSRGDDSRIAPTLAAALAAVIPWTTLLAPVAYVEGAMLLFATLSIGWALTAFNSGNYRFRQMAIAGALAGFACGVKYTAVPMLLLALPPSLLFSRQPSRSAPQAEPARPRAVFSPLLLFLFSGLLTFSPWLVRNALWTGGNPVFPEAMSLLGHAHFSPDQVDRWQQAHSPRPDQRSLPARLHAGWDQIVIDWRYGYALLPLALIAAILARRHPETRTLLILLLITTVIWLFATHLQSRFFILALPLCALIVGLTPWRRRWFIPAAVIPLAAVPSFLTLNDQLTPFLGPFGVTDFKDAMPPAYVKLADEGRDLALVGQAQAFWYQLPMTRLSYRTVFDVDASGTPDPLSPWLGPDPRPGQWLLVYPTELQRFSKTYAHIPPPPPNLLGQPEPVVIPPK